MPMPRRVSLRPAPRRALLAAALVLLSVALLSAAHHTHTHGQHVIPKQVLQVDKLLTQRVGMFAKKDTPLGKKDPYIEAIFDLSYVNSSGLTSNVTTDTLVEIIFTHHSQLDKIGVRKSDWVLCCDAAHYANGDCVNRNRLILQNEFKNLNITDPVALNGTAFYAGNNVFKYNAIFVPREGSNEFSIRFEPMKSGFWYLFLANCDSDINLNVYFEGSTSWYNPYGYLPGQAYGDLISHFAMTAVYCLVLLIWIWRLIVHRKNLQLLQHFTTVLILAGIMNTLFWGETYGAYNRHGHFTLLYVGMSIFFMCVQYMWIRLMVLLMAVGYTITRDKLRGIEIAVMTVLLSCYMVSLGALQYIQLAKLDNDKSVQDWAEPLMMFFEIFFNLILIIWIVTATIRSMAILKKNKSTSGDSEKTGLYKRLLIIFAIATFVIAILFIAEMGIDWAGMRDYAMEWQWLFNADWDFTYLCLSIYVAWVWQPTSNNTRYAYVPLEEVDDTKQTPLEDIDTEAPPARKMDSSSSSSGSGSGIRASESD